MKNRIRFNLKIKFIAVAILFATLQQSAMAQQVILEENFESISPTQALPKGWTRFSTDGDAYEWALNAGMNDLTCAGRGGGQCIASASYTYDTGELTPDNYLVTPLLNDASKVVYYICAQDATAANEHYAVMISKTGTAATDFSIIYEETLGNAPSTASQQAKVSPKAQSEWLKRELVLPSGTKYVAFRHYNCSDNFVICLDDVTIYNYAAPTSYNIFVGKTEVTNANADDVLHDGTVSYDIKSHTITLQGASITTNATPALHILAEENETYTLQLMGTDSIKSQSSNGILSKSPLKIEGNGSLIVENINKSHAAIEAPSVSVNKSTIKAIGKRGICGNSTGELAINAATITASGSEWAIAQFKSFTPTDVIVLSPENAEFNERLQGISINNLLCKEVTIGEDLVLNVDFESQTGEELAQGWKTIDADGDKQCWKIIDRNSINWFIPHSGNKGIISMSWENYNIYTPDNYFISPKIEEAYKLKFHFAVNPVAHADHYAVQVSTSDDKPESFKSIHEETGAEEQFIQNSDAQSVWLERTLLLPANTRHIAFRHYKSTDQNYILIDDIKVYRGVTTSIDNCRKTDIETIEGYYDMMGRKHNKPQPGINIIKLNNGRAYKQFMRSSNMSRH